MKKLWLAIGLASLLAVPAAQAAFDGQVGLTGGSYQFGSGGEFNASSPGGLGTFVTFCIEKNEYINLNGNLMDFKFNDGSVSGGVAGTTPPPDAYTGLSKDRISWGTAWLYSQFRGGTLANYFNASRKDNAGDLQVAIWYLENEQLSLLGDTVSGHQADGNYYVGLATAAAALAGKTVTDDSQGAFGVVALNLFNGQNSQPKTGNGQTWNVNQDMLAIVPEPSTYLTAALLLLPFGASTLRILRKKSEA